MTRLEQRHRLRGGGALPPPRPALPASAPPLHTFTNDDARGGADGGGRRRHAVLEVRPRRAGEPLVGVFVASGGLEAGDLVGCYTGAIVDGAARAAKQQVAPESHLFASTPRTPSTRRARGRMDDTSPPYSTMAVVNERTAGCPTSSPSTTSTAAAATATARSALRTSRRAIEAGDEVTVCYGGGFRRGYESTCADEELLARWTAMQWRLLGSTVRVA